MALRILIPWVRWLVDKVLLGLSVGGGVLFWVWGV